MGLYGECDPEESESEIDAGQSNEHPYRDPDGGRGRCDLVFNLGVETG